VLPAELAKDKTLKKVRGGDGEWMGSIYY
jgi:hypothetical protein